MSERTTRPTDLEYLTTWPRGPDLVRDYVSATPGAVRFYGGHFADPESYRAQAAAVDLRFDAARRERAARALRVSEEGQGRARLDAWVEGNGFAVTTGQQPGLLTGPLFSVYKALTAIHLARMLESTTGRPVLPIFWVASEDHDWAESGHAYVLDRFEEPRRLEATPAAAPAERPLHRVELTDADGLASELRRRLPESAFAPDWIEAARAAYSGASLATGMADLMLELLGPLGLSVCQAHHPMIKRASEGVLRSELENGGEHASRLAARCRALQEAGYGVQVPILDGALNVFMESATGSRERLYRTEKGLRLHPSGTLVTEAEALEAMGNDTMSPNVLLRPVAESAVFPTLAYVGGPGELAYFAELAPLFESLDMRVPVLHPRVSVTVVPHRIRSILDKFSVAPDGLGVPEHELASRWARSEMPADVDRALEAWEASIEPHATALNHLATRMDPTLQGPVTRARNVAREGVEHLRGKILTAIKRNGEVSLRQILRARTWLYPDGVPQERRFSAFTFLARYGDGFVDELNEHVGRHVDAIHGTAPVP